MKKAVISTGGRQYLVSEGQELEVGNLPEAKATTFEALAIIDGDNVTLGSPIITGSKVSADILDANVKGEKVVAIRFKAKKRVHKRRGHRQSLSRIKVTKIA